MMTRLPLIATLLITATPILAQETRQLDSHEHGVGQLNIAFDGAQIAMEFEAPGADIVGFEYEAKSADDRSAIEDAVALLEQPLSLFGLPDAAGCTVTEANVEHENHGDEDDHGDHDGHGDHDDHADGDDHGDHDDHAEEAGHTEFHAEYLLTCADPSALTDITFAYFDTFANAQEVEVQIISDTGAASFEVERDMPTLDLSGAL